MTIDLNERLAGLAAEAIDGVRLEHPQLRGPGRANRRRSGLTIMLAVGAVAAMIVAVVVLVGRPAEVRTGPAVGSDATSKERVMAAMTALGTTSWSATVEYPGSSYALAHDSADRFMLTGTGTGGSGNDGTVAQILDGDMLYSRSVRSEPGNGPGWQRSTNVGGLPLISRILSNISAMPCWSEPSPGVVVAVDPCGGTGESTTSVQSDDGEAGDSPSGEATITLIRGRISRIVVRSFEPGEENQEIGFTFDYGEVPPITLPDPSSVTDAPVDVTSTGSGPATSIPVTPTTVGTTGTPHNADIGMHLRGIGTSTFEIDQSNQPTLVAVITPWCNGCAQFVDRLLQLSATGGIPQGLQLLVVSTAPDGSLPQVVDLDRLRQAGITVVEDVSETGGDYPAPYVYDVTSYPTLVAADSAATIVARDDGPDVDLQAMIERAMSTSGG